jgi:hypothetical protein
MGLGAAPADVNLAHPRLKAARRALGNEMPPSVDAKLLSQPFLDISVREKALMQGHSALPVVLCQESDVRGQPDLQAGQKRQRLLLRQV